MYFDRDNGEVITEEEAIKRVTERYSFWDYLNDKSKSILIETIIDLFDGFLDTKTIYDEYIDSIRENLSCNFDKVHFSSDAEEELKREFFTL